MTWTSTNGGSFATGTSTTNSLGVATVVFTPSTVAGATHVVTGTTGSLHGSSPTITVAAGSASKYVVSSSASSVVAGSPVSITAQLTDAFGNVVTTGGQTVTWSSTNGGSFAPTTSATNSSGVATTTFTTSTTAGTSHIVTATTGGVSGSTTAITTTVGAAAKYVVTTNTAAPTAGGTVTVTAQLADANGNSVATSGQTVTWTKSGAGGSFASGTSTTDGNGVATVVFTTAVTAGVSYAFTGTDGSNRTGTSGTVTSVAGSPTKYVVTTSASTVDAGDPVTITAQLVDANNNVVHLQGVVVTWSNTGSGGSFASPTSTTDVNGTASVVFTTDNSATIVYKFIATDQAGHSGTSGSVLSLLGSTENFTSSLSGAAAPPSVLK